MNILLLIIAVISVAEFIYILKTKREVLNMYARLTKVFSDAVDGKDTDLTYDESVLSSLYEKITRYIKVNNIRLESSKAEKESLQMIISNVSHQIAQPVSEIHLYSEMLLEKEVNDDDKKMIVNIINRQSNKLKFIFEVMLKSSRLESGLIKISNIREQSVKALISNTISDLINIIIKKNIDIMVDIPNDMNARFDMKWTGEAVYNIIENAVKYTPSGGKITIKAVKYEMYVRLDIIDTGIGIAKKEYTYIFRRFYRSESAKDYNGLGIGLYLTREIISREGGYVSVSSVPGKGSVFSVFLPCQK